MTTSDRPWYETTVRWAQTNLTEIDPTRYDSDFWRAQWKATRVQGVIVNAGGIVAYYPSENPLHHRASGLGDGDLYGDIVTQARQDGLVVVARMDSSRAGSEFYAAHPDWFAHDAEGQPFMAGPKHVACVNSPYYSEFLPSVFREVIERSSPDGFADNSWAGLEAAHICACGHCHAAFRAATGEQLPRVADFDDPVYRQWQRWNVARRTEVWRENSRLTSEAGGPHCVWVGMLSGDVGHLVERFVDLRAVSTSSPILLLDHQRRTGHDGFAQNAETGLRMHALAGDDVLLPESMAMYSAGHGFFRATSMPTAEVRIWAESGFAGGIQPWWHHISAVHEDRRQYATAEPLFRWHEENEQHLVGRSPLADVAVLWSEDNVRFHGREDVDNTGVAPYRGVVHALSRARVPYLPWHVDDLDRLPSGVRTVVLPDLAVLTDEQAAAVRSLVDRGIGLVATGSTSLRDGDGVLRPDFALGDVLGVRLAGPATGDAQPLRFRLDEYDRHDYLRFDRSGQGREVFTGFEDTSIIALGGRVETVDVVDAQVVGTYVEPFPTYPPETAWLPPEPTTRPVVTVREAASGARIAYCAADVDRMAARDHRPDHLRLVADLVQWAVAGDPLLEVEGVGALDCHVFAREVPGVGSETVLHLVNTGSLSPVPGTHDEVVPVGPLTVRMRGTAPAATARLLVAGGTTPVTSTGGSVQFQLTSVVDHEVVVLEGV